MSERQERKAESFRALHEGEPFVIPNPWDAGSARMLEALGFDALATTSSGFAFTLTARAENHIRGNPDLDDTIARLRAYEEAGADVLFAPGLRDANEVGAVCAAVSKPVNVLAHRGLRMDEIVAAGAQRVSVGGALTFVAVGAMAAAAQQIRDGGDFGVLAVDVPIRDWLSA